MIIKIIPRRAISLIFPSTILMKEQILQGITLIVVSVSYFTWRFNMIGFSVVYLLFLVYGFAMGILFIIYFRKPMDKEKRKIARTLFSTILLLFLAAVLIRIIFLR